MRPIARVPGGRRTGGTRMASRAVVAFLAFAAAGALARPVPMPLESPPPPEPAPTAMTVQRGISLEQAVELALRRYPGRVVKMETTARNGRRVHEIRILVEGEGDPRMRIIRIDAETGRFL